MWKGDTLCVRVFFFLVLFLVATERHSFCTFSTLIQMSIESRVELSPFNAPLHPLLSPTPCTPNEFKVMWKTYNEDEKPISLNISIVLTARQVVKILRLSKLPKMTLLAFRLNLESVKLLNTPFEIAFSNHIGFIVFQNILRFLNVSQAH